MTQETSGRNTPRALRIPDGLWERIEQWAEVHAVNPSEAVRSLVQIGMEAPAAVHDSPLLPPLTWMLKQTGPKKQRHACAAIVLPPTDRNGKPLSPAQQVARRMTAVCLGAPCAEAWKLRPAEWALVRVVQGPGFWDVADLVAAAEGAAELPGGSQGRWYAVPRTSLDQLLSALGPRRRGVAIHSPS
jgi:hypothetical protein